MSRVALRTCQGAVKNMSLLKPLAMTPARLAANRRNTQKSTAPRTLRAKAQSRMNGLRNGGYSRLYLNVLETLVSAPPGAVDKMAQAVITPELAAHPLFVELVELACHAESGKPLVSPQMQRAQEKLMDAVRATMPPPPRWVQYAKPTGIPRGDERKKKKYCEQSH